MALTAEQQRVFAEVDTISSARRLLDRYGFGEGVTAAAHGFGYAVSFDALCDEPSPPTSKRLSATSSQK